MVDDCGCTRAACANGVARRVGSNAPAWAPSEESGCLARRRRRWSRCTRRRRLAAPRLRREVVHSRVSRKPPGGAPGHHTPLPKAVSLLSVDWWWPPGSVHGRFTEGWVGVGPSWRPGLPVRGGAAGRAYGGLSWMRPLGGRRRRSEAASPAGASPRTGSPSMGVAVQ